MRELITFFLILSSIFSYAQWSPQPVYNVPSNLSIIKFIPPCGERYFDNGRISSKCECEGEKINGKYTIWNINGMKNQEQTFEMDVLKKKVLWYDDGKIKSIEHFFDQDHCYKRVQYRPSGNKEFIEHYDWEGEYHGLRITYFENGNLEREENFEHGKQKGILKVYSRDKKEVIIQYAENYKKEGKYQKFFNNKLIESGNYKSDKKEGLWQYFELGNSVISSEIIYEKDVEVSVKNYINKELKNSMNYQTGEYLEFDFKQNLVHKWHYKAKEPYKDHERSGLQQDFNSDGKLVAEYWLHEGRYCDQSKFYDTDSNYRLIRFGTYENLKKYPLLENISYAHEYLINSNGDTLEQRLIVNSVNAYQIVTTNYYENNIREGKWKIAYLNSGVIYKEVTYKNGILDGPFILFANGSYKKFGKTSPYEKGIDYTEGTYVNNVLKGSWIHYFVTEDTTYIFEKANYNDGLLEGYRIRYNYGVQNIFENYHLGQLHGTFESRWPSGELIETGNYDFGKRHGFWKLHNNELRTKHGYNLGGMAYEGSYNQGIRDGYWKHYDQYGHLASEGNYENGIADGHWIFYIMSTSEDENERPKKHSEGKFEGEKKIGTWIYYDDKGKVYDKMDYDKYPWLNDV